MHIKAILNPQITQIYADEKTEVGCHPGEMRSDKLNAKCCDPVNLTRQAVVNEFHRAGRSEGQGTEGWLRCHVYR